MGCLLGEGGPNPVRSLHRTSAEIRARVDLQVAGTFAHQSPPGRRLTSMVPFVSAKLTQYPESRRTRARSSSSGMAILIRSSIGSVTRLTSASVKVLGWIVPRGIELMVGQTASPGIGDPRTRVDASQLIGDRQNTGDMVRGLEIGHPDVSTPVALYKVWQRMRGSQSSTELTLRPDPHGVMRSRSCPEPEPKVPSRSRKRHRPHRPDRARRE